MVREPRRAALRKALEDMRRYRGTFSRAAFSADGDAQRLVLHAMLVAVQACIDEALESCRRHDCRHDGSYRDAFLALARAGLLAPEIAGQMANWASMRNVVAHFYPVLDQQRVYAALEQLEQIEGFEAWLETR